MRDLRRLLAALWVSMAAVLVPAQPAASADAPASPTASATVPGGLPPFPAVDFSRYPLVPVRRVVDGDTLIVLFDGRERICRLVGVDTPETVHPDRPPEPGGAEASAFLRRMLEGEHVWAAVPPGEERYDRYGRQLVVLFRAPDGLCVNLEIVRLGYGRVVDSADLPLREHFLAYEARARALGRGIWSETSGAGGGGSPGASNGGTAGTVDSWSGAGVDPQVYVTGSGTRYHRAECRHLTTSRRAIPLSQARARYQPCAVCNPPQ